MDSGLVILIIVLGIMLLMIHGILSTRRMRNEVTRHLAGIGGTAPIPAGKYLSGHPSIDSAQAVEASFTEKEMVLFPGFASTTELGRVPLSGIEDVSIAESSFVGTHLPVSRSTALGILALGARKKVRKNITCVTIRWHGEGNSFETQFAFDTSEPAIRFQKEIRERAKATDDISGT